MSSDGKSDGGHLSIGEVLALLQDEFPDVTISKIRFLESQGLIDPERTPSGYRKFYAEDVERLRWILVQQRDHFLPLRVIKERLEARAPEDVPAGEAPPPPRPPRPPELVLPLDQLDDEIVPNRPAEAASAEAASAPAEPETFDRISLARAAGLTDAQLDELEHFGLVTPFHDDGIRATFDRDALAIARAATGLFRHGIEARHLKMYVHFTEREAALFRQVLLPFLRQRHPEARTRTVGTLEDLVRDARALRGALLRRAVREAIRE